MSEQKNKKRDKQSIQETAPDTEKISAPTDDSTAQKKLAPRELTDVEKMQQRRRKDMAFKRAMQTFRETDDKGREEIYEKVHLDRAVYKPRTLKEKWENYWYHYAFTTVIIAFLVVLVGWFVYDMMNKTTYDFDMMILDSGGTYMNVEETIKPVQENLKKYVTDIDENGSIDMSLENIELDQANIEGTDPNIVMANTTKYSVTFSEGTILVYLIDEAYYNQLHEQGIEFEDLTKFGDNENIKGEKYYIENDADFATLNGKENLFLVMRKQDNIHMRNDKAKAKFAERYEIENKIVEQILAE